MTAACLVVCHILEIQGENIPPLLPFLAIKAFFRGGSGSVYFGIRVSYQAS